MHLLPATPKHEGVADLEPHDVLPRQDAVRAPPEDFALRLDGAARELARHQQLPLHQVQNLLRYQPIRNDQVRTLKRLVCLHREQLRIPWAGADQRDGSHFCVGWKALGNAGEHVLVDDELALRVDGPDLDHAVG